MGLHRSYHRFFDPLTVELKIRNFTLNEALILLSIFFENPKAPTPTAIEKNLGIAKDRISQALKNLESKQLITRELSKTDKRKRELSLTNHGKKSCAPLIEVFEKCESHYETFLGL